MEKKPPSLKNFEDFKRRVVSLPLDQQKRVLAKAFDLIYDKLDDKVWRTIATAIKHAKDEELEGHEDFKIDDKELKKLSHIQDGYRKKDH